MGIRCIRCGTENNLSDIFETVMQMLSRNPELQLYTLHDASPRGVSLVHQLRTSSNWFQK